MKILFIDIETAPNTAHVWGLWNQNIGLNQLREAGYTMSFAAKWQGEKEVKFKSGRGKPSKSMIKAAHKLIDEADVVVHYNGKKFDMPTLNREFLLYGLKPPKPYTQIDLLNTVRSSFRFPSNKLAYVSDKLGLGGKEKHEGHDMWVKCMAGNKQAWSDMERYNKKDVILLEKLYERLLPWIKSHPNRNDYDSHINHCPSCASDKLQKRGFHRTAAKRWQRYQCTDCGSWSKSTTGMSNKVTVRP